MQAIIIDLDDTLLDDGASMRHALLAFLVAHQIAKSGESEGQAVARWRAISAHHWLRFERGEVSFLEQRRARVRDFLGRPLDATEADAAFEPYRVAYESSWTLVPECGEFLRRTASVPKVIVTNGERTQQLRKIERTGLGSHVRATVTPEDCGHWKPHPGIFAAALQALDAEPSSCLMIGDDLIRDIEPARRLGIPTFHVRIGDPMRTLLHAIDAT